MASLPPNRPHAVAVGAPTPAQWRESAAAILHLAKDDAERIAVGRKLYSCDDKEEYVVIADALREWPDSEWCEALCWMVRVTPGAYAQVLSPILNRFPKSYRNRPKSTK